LNSLKIERFRKKYHSDTVLTSDDILNFYRLMESDVKNTTVNWRIYHLVQSGVIARIGKGRYKVGGVQRAFEPEISLRAKRIYGRLHRAFPLLSFCLWETSAINEFMRHQPGRFYIIVETEKEALNSVFYHLKEQYKSTFLKPSNDVLEYYVSDKEDVILLLPLIKEAPLIRRDGMPTASLEKILVDIFADKKIFAAFQGVELRRIFSEAFSKYVINYDKMLRYASRRGAKSGLREYLSSERNLDNND
jgi:hypothetical protein